MLITRLPPGNVGLDYTDRFSMSALNDLEDEVGTDHTDHTDHLFDMWNCLSRCSGREKTKARGVGYYLGGWLTMKYFRNFWDER